MTEEQVTKAILKWLVENKWKIICYDFPQSGTGKVLHHNERISGNKNKSSLIPDIVAIKNDQVVFIENKDRFELSDVEKLNRDKIKNNYSESIKKLLKPFVYKDMYFGIGIPSIFSEKAINYKDKIDFILKTDGFMTEVTYQNTSIF